MNQEIKKINKLLVQHFDIPKRNANPSPPIDMLIATILSQNTNDNNSYKAYIALKEKYKTWDALLNVEREEIEEVIKIAGLGKQKSSAIKNVISELNKKFGKIDLDFINEMTNKDAVSELICFPGVGVKTASCVLLFSMGKDICPVDTHVHRTLNRIGLVKTNSPDKTFEAINKNFPKGIAHQFHTNLIKLGREICKPTNPACSICPVEKICKYENKNFENRTKRRINGILLLDNV
ncbi:MAG: endonuclease III [Melioribacteraceae bacterium]|nr:endonuclease III [Melioribacteraceae bacterium]